MSDDAQKLGTILIVDDETMIRIMAADILQDEGFRVLEAANAEEALAVIERHGEVGLLFSDINMPGSMNGIELSAEITRRWPAIKILIASGRERPVESSLPDYGTFLAKPYSIGELLAAVRRKVVE